MAEVETINGNPIVAEVASESIQPSVDAWLAAHPEATTTVQDNSITDAKLVQTGGVLDRLKFEQERISSLDGYVIPMMELGKISAASTAIAFQDSSTSIRTPQGQGVPVKVNDIISLTDYTAAKFKWVIDLGTGRYAYASSYLASDYHIVVDGTLYLVVAKTDDSVVSDVVALSSLVRIRRFDGAVDEISYLQNHQSILEKGHFITEFFANGDISSGLYLPAQRRHRVSTIRPLSFSFDVVMTAYAGYRFYPNTRNGDGTWNAIGWKTSFAVNAGTEFMMVIAKTAEDASVIPEPSEFVEKINVSTNFKDSAVPSIAVDDAGITTYMSRFYNGGNAESFAFFTDPHLMGSGESFSESTFSQYIDALAGTVRNASIPYVVCGGDWLNSGDTKEQAARKLGYVDGQMRATFPSMYYPIVGNHDFNYLGVDESGNRLTEQSWISNAAMRGFWFSEHEHCYYKFKRNVSQNYVLDTRTDHDGIGLYDKEQMDWLAEQLVSDDPSHATIMGHIFYLASVGTTKPNRILAIGKIIEAYNAHSLCTLTAVDGYEKTYDFTSTTGHIDYVLVGHSHADFTDTLGGVQVVGSVNFQNGDMPSFDLVYADYDNRTLYLTRFGTGSDRQVAI